MKIGGRLVLYPWAALVDWLDRLAKQPTVEALEPGADADELERVRAAAERTIAETDELLRELGREGVGHG